MTSAKEELTERIRKMVNDGMKNIHVTWAPEAADLTEEERAKHFLEFLDERDKYEALPTEEKMRLAIKEAYEKMLYCLKILSYNRISEVSQEELERRISKAWGAMDTGVLPLGNWLTEEEKREIRGNIRETARINNAEDLL